MDETTDLDVEKRRPRRSRTPYHKKYGRVIRHMDWYLRLSLDKAKDTSRSIEEIQKELENETGIKLDPDTIRKFNAQQFLRYETAPLARVSDSEYILNNEYYRIMGGYVSEPGMAKLGRHKNSDYIKPPTKNVIVLTL